MRVYVHQQRCTQMPLSRFGILKQLKCVAFFLFVRLPFAFFLSFCLSSVWCNEYSTHTPRHSPSHTGRNGEGCPWSHHNKTTESQLKAKASIRSAPSKHYKRKPRKRCVWYPLDIFFFTLTHSQVRPLRAPASPLLFFAFVRLIYLSKLHQVGRSAAFSLSPLSPNPLSVQSLLAHPAPLFFILCLPRA